ncbi:somatostatin-1A-like [Acanthopagrus latus]|uniref:somatostatin-1A-like n=1 Tax=Acanthopagrus latus TaxID=8177 RepID=UPI00187CAE19|nr:somatostatin-1A-like [Acanthopagrus latus]
MLLFLTTKNSLSTSTISQPTMARVLCILALLCFASCVAENAETEQEFKDLQLQPGPLSWLDKLRGVQQESTRKQSFTDFLYKLFKSENGVIPQEPAETDTREKNRRGLGGVMAYTRKAGCRVFYWKTLTAC